MKIPLSLALLCFALVSHAQIDTGKYRGDYFGVLVPVGSACSNERLLINVEILPNGDLSGSIWDWDAVELNTLIGYCRGGGAMWFSTGPQPGDDGWSPFDTRINWQVKGKLSPKSGKLTGSVDARNQGGCRYTFTAYRRYKVPPL